MALKVRCEVYSRVVGYFRPLSQWNPGKQKEFKDRNTFKITEETINKARKRQDETVSKELKEF